MGRLWGEWGSLDVGLGQTGCVLGKKGNGQCVCVCVRPVEVVYGHLWSRGYNKSVQSAVSGVCVCVCVYWC